MGIFVYFFRFASSAQHRAASEKHDLINPEKSANLHKNRKKITLKFKIWIECTQQYQKYFSQWRIQSPGMKFLLSIANIAGYRQYAIARIQYSLPQITIRLLNVGLGPIQISVAYLCSTSRLDKYRSVMKVGQWEGQGSVPQTSSTE